MTDVPDTVTEAVAELRRRGYVDELRIVPTGVAGPSEADVEPVAAAVAEEIFRFEGPSDPADEAIVLGVHCPTLGLRGVIVAAFGPSVDPEDEAILLALLDGRT